MAVDTYEATIRFLHITFGIFWVGAVLFQHVLMAALRTLPAPMAGPTMLAIGRRALPAGATAGVLTVVFGIWSQWIIYGALDYRATTANVALGVALVAAIIMLLMAFFLQMPTFRKMEAMAPKGPPPAGAPAPTGPPPAIVALQKRMMVGLMIGTVLALTAVAAMVVAVLSRTSG